MQPPPAPEPVAVAPVETDFIKPGIYETPDPSSPRVRIYLYLSPNHGFILRWTQQKESIVEYRGAWSSDPDSLRLQVYDVRRPREDMNVGTAVRLDTLISCPIQQGAAFPVPVLKLAAIKGGNRLVQMAKPENGGAWEGDKGKGKAKGRKGSRSAAKSGKGRNGKDTPSAAAKAEVDPATLPKTAKASGPES
jgi:hypothetical protein